MILSLIRAESIKATRQRSLFFFAYLFVPAFMTLLPFVFGGDIQFKTPNQETMQLLHSMARSLGVGGSPIAQLFFALGAASIFTVDYRYSGWRQIIPRASRSSILSAKACMFALFAGVSLLLIAAGDLCGNIAVIAMRGTWPTNTDFNGASAILLLLAFVISFVELISLGAVIAAVATLTRSMMAAVLLPFLLCLTASTVESFLGESTAAYHFPTFAADTLRRYLGLRAGLSGSQPSTLGWAIATLVIWCLVGFGIAIATFQRQDLVAE